MPGWFDDALQYAQMGWRLIPLHARDKRPHPKAWQTAATTDPKVLEEWAERWPDSNLGVVLGPASGIIDIECDSEAEEEILNKLAGSAESIPVTPTYQSARGKHRLFKWSPDLPEVSKGIFYIGKLGFRTGNGEKGAQSALPPSIHPSGASYQWLVPPEVCEPAEIPAEMMARIVASVVEGVSDLDATAAGVSTSKRKPDTHWQELAKGLPEGGTELVEGRNAGAAQLCGKMLGDLRDPYDSSAVSTVWEMVQAWNERNKPPLPFKDLKTTFESILRRQRASWTAKQTKEASEKNRDRDPETGEPSKAEWRIEKVLYTEPVVWRLYAPDWEYKAPGGFINLSTEELVSGAKIRVEAVKQAGVWLEKWFTGFWEGQKGPDKEWQPGLAKQLLEIYTCVEGSPEESRELVLAEMLHDQLRGAKKSDDPDPRGAPREMSDGSVWFKVQYILGQLNFGPEPPTSKELAKLLKQIKADDRQHARDGSNSRYKRLGAAALDKLRKKAIHGAEAADPLRKLQPVQREPGDEDELLEGEAG